MKAKNNINTPSDIIIQEDLIPELCEYLQQQDLINCTLLNKKSYLLFTPIYLQSLNNYKNCLAIDFKNRQKSPSIIGTYSTFAYASSMNILTNKIKKVKYNENKNNFIL